MTEAPVAAAPKQNKVLPKDTQRPPGDIRRRVAKKERTGPFVKYVGSAAKRRIDPTAWATLNIGLKDTKATHEWNIGNDKMIEASDFSDEQLDYLLVDDTQKGTGIHNFLLVTYDDSKQLVQVEYE